MLVVVTTFFGNVVVVWVDVVCFVLVTTFFGNVAVGCVVVVCLMGCLSITRLGCSFLISSFGPSHGKASSESVRDDAEISGMAS